MSDIAWRQMMTARIFKVILFVVVAVLFTSLIIVTGMLCRYFGDVQEAQLRDNLHLTAGAVEQLGKSYLENIASDQYRITWVAADGIVLFDNWADASRMENHADREEIREAAAAGMGQSIRYSDTLTEQTVYEALRLSDGSVLRMSASRATALVLGLGLMQPIGMVLLIAMLFSAWLAHRMANRIMEPLNRLDLDRPLEREVYEELSPLLYRIHTQRVEIEEQIKTLKQKQDEFEQITGHMKEALILLDNKGRILSINPVAQELFKTKRTCIGADFLTVDCKADMCNALRETKETGQAVFSDTKEGREYRFHISRIDSEGECNGMVMLGFDVTEQVQAEKHRKEFTANVSHELKTPLQSIIGSAELMENHMVKDEDVPRFMGRIRREAARLITVIDDIIRLSRLDEGAEMPKEKIALKALVEEVCGNLSETAERKQILLTAAGDEGVICGVRRLLYDIIYNLCDNAIKYNRPGGSVKVSVEEQSDEICLRVKDTGIGIGREHQEKIFERFYRVDKSHSKQYGGTGLGLSIVKHGVQYHHGTIELESEPDKGTMIVVRFKKDA